MIAALMFLAATALAHHAALGYNFTTTESAHATLKEMLWSAPHSTLIFEIKAPDGHLQELPLGGSAPGKIMKEGFNPRDFKVGDKFDVTWHPAVNGKLGGIVASIKFKDGRAAFCMWLGALMCATHDTTGGRPLTPPHYAASAMSARR